MKPLIFEFLEKRNEENFDFSMIGYDDELNLSIDKKTGKPAINGLMLSTRTVTNVCEEDSDSDKNNESHSFLMITQTRTVTDVCKEESDSDKNDGNLSFLMATQTRTFANEEGADTDRNENNTNIIFLMGTMTKTATSESSDRD